MSKLNLFCPFCGMPNEVAMVFDKDSQSWAAQCPDCYACGPLETTAEAALKSWRRRDHDVEWCYRQGVKIARQFAEAIGQTDEVKIGEMATLIGNQLSGFEVTNPLKL